MEPSPEMDLYFFLRYSAAYALRAAVLVIPFFARSHLYLTASLVLPGSSAAIS